MENKRVWSNRFLIAALIQSIFAVAWTIPIVLPWIKPSVAMVIAAGSAGTWFTVGYVLYILVGVLGVAATGLVYGHFESQGKEIKGLKSALAWLHLILLNVGAAAVGWGLMLAGYFGEAYLLPPYEGGRGLTVEQVHVIYLSHFITPMGMAVIVAALGAFIGAITLLSVALERQ